jgi:hypothetical protein
MKANQLIRVKGAIFSELNPIYSETPPLVFCKISPQIRSFKVSGRSNKLGLGLTFMASSNLQARKLLFLNGYQHFLEPAELLPLKRPTLMGTDSVSNAYLSVYFYTMAFPKSHT